ncbi:MAG: hypothetical protein WDO72_12305 [Pseudomonadota bacterium]
MKTTSIVAVVLAALLGLASVGGIWRINSDAPRKPYPKAAPPPAPSAEFHPAKDPAPTQEEIERDARERNGELARGIERALRSSNPVELETAFTHLLSQLLQFEPARVAAMVARQAPGDARETLRTEVARLWITRDPEAAIEWLKTLDDAERSAAAAAAVDSVAASAPGQAIEVAYVFGIGRDDGYLENLVHGWAMEDFAAAARWIGTQPAGGMTEQLRARIELVRLRKRAAGG